MKRGLRLSLSLALASCAVTVRAPSGVQVEGEASVAELVRAIAEELRARGHRGECFLAWDAARADLHVRVGGQSRRAALSCGGFDALADTLEGRCPAARVVWTGDGSRPTAMTIVFGPPGHAFAQSPWGLFRADRPARDALFFPDEGGLAVLAIDLEDGRARARANKGDSLPPDTPLADPAVDLALRQLVARAQRCNESGEGSLVLEWRTLPDGTVTQVRPLASSVDEQVVRCVVDQVRASSFPERRGELRPVDYCAPVLLSPALRPAS